MDQDDQEVTTIYKEPAPIKDKENPFESMMERFDVKVGRDAVLFTGLDYF